MVRNNHRLQPLCVQKSESTPSWPSVSDFDERRRNDWPTASARFADQANDNRVAPSPDCSVRELGAHCNISVETLYREIEDGRLQAMKARGQ